MRKKNGIIAYRNNIVKMGEALVEKALEVAHRDRFNARLALWKAIQLLEGKTKEMKGR